PPPPAGLAAAQPAPDSQASPSAMQWINGTLESHSYYRACWPESAQTLTSEYIGYYGATDASFPKVGDVYYAHVVVGVVGSSCAGGADVNTEVWLPEGTNFAVSEQNKIRCWYYPASGNPPEEVTDNQQAGCPKTPTQGTHGASLGFRIVPNGGIFEVQFPLYSTRELRGMSQNEAKMTGLVEVSIAGGWSFPEQWVFVAPNPPTVEYAAPATTKVTATSAHGTAAVWNRFTKGQAFFDIGTTTAYGAVSPPFAISDEHWGYPEVFADWTGLQPSTTYHWRIRYVTSTGQTYAGPDQTFTTAAGTPGNVTVTLTQPANGTIEISPPGGSYAPGTTVTVTARPNANYRFAGWQINGADGGAANPRTLVVQANTTVGAGFAFVDPNTLGHRIFVPAIIK
ncbi:MAG TPA: hypothetical protein VD886_24135, partial [Herpetosiphonaceae bacterium]|nr:hypothetical protein [Herpetosiphonaceae bacterium]